MTSKDLPAARYEQVKHHIMEEISSGRWKPQQKISSEAELTDQFGFARMTVHRALRELSSEGVLTRIPGVGTFVASVKSHSALSDLKDIKNEIVSRGQRHDAEVIALERVRATDEVANELGRPRAGDVFHSVVVHKENGVPIMFEERFVNPDIVPEYLAQDFRKLTTRAYLVQVIPVTEVEHTIHAVHPQKRLRRLLKISESEACILLLRRTWSGRQVATTNRFVYPGSRYCLISRHPVEIGLASGVNSPYAQTQADEQLITIS